MQLSLTKTVVLKYGCDELDIDGDIIPTADHAKDLGVLMKANLDFSLHINMYNG